MEDRKISAVIIGFFLLFVKAKGLELRDACLTPLKDYGICINIKDCPPLVEILNKKDIPTSTLDLLRKSLCGFQELDPLVCCPPPKIVHSSTSPPTAIAASKPKFPPPPPLSPTSLRPPIAASKPKFPTSTLTPKPEDDFIDDIVHHKNIDLLTLNRCGKIYNPDILDVPGNNTKLFEFPWMALLSYNDASGRTFKCSGSIISKKYILTAAHCVAFLPRNLRLISVRLGEYNLDTEIDCEDRYVNRKKERVCSPTPIDAEIEEIIPHPDFKVEASYENDIALVRLGKTLNFSHDYIQPVCLPAGSRLIAENLIGKTLIISGWKSINMDDLSRVLLKNAIPGIKQEDCIKEFKNIVTISYSSHLCAGGGNISACLGDAGGPLVHFRDLKGKRRAIQYGIMSFSSRHCEAPAKPVVYTRVTTYMKWILDNMKP